MVGYSVTGKTCTNTEKLEHPGFRKGVVHSGGVLRLLRWLVFWGGFELGQCWAPLVGGFRVGGGFWGASRHGRETGGNFCRSGLFVPDRGA